MNLVIDNTTCEDIVFRTGGTSYPLDRLCYGNDVVWERKVDYSTQYFTIESQVDGNTITLTKGSNASDINYSISRDGDTWSVYSTTQSFAIDKGEKIMFKANTSNRWRYWNFNSTGNYKVYGNIMSLIYGDDFARQTTLPSTYQFASLFDGSAHLTDAENLILPATTLVDWCYQNMFRRCTSLTKIPKLPATTLATGCYYYMFYGCSSLRDVPELPATSLTDQCYYGMFYNCTSLTMVVELPATTLAESCYGNMFFGCTGLGEAPVLPATTLARFCYSSMFQNCTSLREAPELPATTLTDLCYSYMFAGCSALETAPELPATTLATGCYMGMFYGCMYLKDVPELPATTLEEMCYYYMFRNCYLLNYIKCMATDISANECTYYWVDGVARTGTFVKASSMNDWPNGISGIPNGWTVQDA